MIVKIGFTKSVSLLMKKIRLNTSNVRGNIRIQYAVESQVQKIFSHKIAALFITTYYHDNISVRSSLIIDLKGQLSEKRKG